MINKLKAIFMWSKAGIIIVLLFCIPTLVSLLKPGFFPTHDFIHVARLYEMEVSLKDGQFPVRWVPDFRYGEPLFNFYAPLPFYLGTLIRLSSLSFLDVTKILFGLSFILSAITMYLLGKELFGRFGGIISAVFYTYAPYHAVDVYVRGALSESLALAVFPLIFWSALKLSKKATCHNCALLALSLAALFFTHNIMTVLFTPFIIGWFAFLILINKNYKLIKYYLFSSVLGILLAASFLLPAFFEKDLVQSSKLITGYFDFRGHFVEIKQFFIPFWGYGASLWGSEDGFSLQIGIVHWIGLLISLVAAIFAWIKKKRFIALLVVFLTAEFIFSLFMQHNRSTPIWLSFPFLAYTQFPWRFLGISIFLISLIIGSLATYLNKKLILVGIFMIILVVAFNISYFHPDSYYLDATDENYVSSRVLSIDDKLPKDYLPIWVKSIPSDKITQPVVKSGEAKILDFQKRSDWAKIQVQSEQDSNIEVPITYFPGWKVWVDQKEIPIDTPTELGLIKISVPKGEHIVILNFANTPIMTIGNMMSLVGLILLILLTTSLIKKYERKII